MSGVELATAYVSIVGSTAKLKKDIESAFADVDKASIRAGKSISSNLGDGFSGAKSQAAKAGADAADAYQKSLHASIRGEQIGAKIGLVLGKSMGVAIKGGIGVAAAGATAAVGALTLSLTKGFARLRNIDNAKFKLQALGNSASDVKTIMDSALASVKGTAFGLDQAANTAATAVAAGVPQGKSLTDYLTNVADAAAIAQTSMDEMGSIFNKVQTNGKAMTDDLQMLADRGLPIFTWLQKQYGVTGEALQKMVEDGKVSSADFQRAISANIGGAALKMGESFQGALDNANAALGRLGAALLAPAFENAAGGIGSLTGALDAMGVWLGQHKAGVIDFWAALGKAAATAAQQTLLGVSDMLEAVAGLAGGIGNVVGVMDKFQAWQADIRGDRQAAADLREQAEAAFGWGEGLQDLSDKLAGAADKAGSFYDTIGKWADTAKAAAAVADALGDSFIKINDNGQIIVESNAMEKLQELNDLGLVVTNLPDGKFEVVAGTPQAQALVDAFVAKNSSLPPAKLPVDVDVSAASAKLTQLYNDIFKAPPGANPGGGNPLAFGPAAAGDYVPYDPAKIARRPSFGGGRAGGGEITGPGPKGKDSVLMYGAPGEHMLTTDDVAAMGGQSGVYAFRRALHSGIPGYDNGGAVAAIDNAYNNSGKPYNYGAWDCSAYMSYVYAGMAGLPPGRYFTTESDFEALGFKKGYKPGALNIGIRRGGGGPNSHMAGTLPNGVNIENAGMGSIYGGNAAGARDFPIQYYYEPPQGGDVGEMQQQSAQGSVDPNTTVHGDAMGAAPGPAGSTYSPQSPGDVGRTQGYIPAAAGSSTTAGTSFLSGLYGMGAEVINGIIDQASSAASTAAAAAIAGGTFGAGGAGGSQAGAMAAQFAIGLGTNAAKRGVQYGAQMLGIGTDALIEQLTPFGAPRLLSTDVTAFMPQQAIMAAATSSIEKAMNPQAGEPNAPTGPGSNPNPFGTPTARLPEPTPAPGPDSAGVLRANTDMPPAAVTGNDYSVHYGNITVQDVNDLQRQTADRQRMQMMRYSGRPTPG